MRSETTDVFSVFFTSGSFGSFSLYHKHFAAVDWDAVHIGRLRAQNILNRSKCVDNFLY
jgi:catechol-2,3-dioxygenase